MFDEFLRRKSRHLVLMYLFTVMSFLGVAGVAMASGSDQTVESTEQAAHFEGPTDPPLQDRMSPQSGATGGIGTSQQSSLLQGNNGVVVLQLNNERLLLRKISSQITNSVQNRIVENIMNKAKISGKARDYSGNRTNIDIRNEGDNWFDVSASFNDVVGFRNTSDILKNQYTSISLGRVMDTGVSNNVGTFNSSNTSVFFNFLNDNSKYDSIATNSVTMSQNSIGFGILNNTMLFNDSVFVDALLNARIVKNKVGKKGRLLLAGKKDTFNSSVVGLSARSGFNVKLFNDLLNIEPSILASFNIIKNSGVKADKFMNIIPVIRLNLNIIDSWKFGIVLRNVNVIGGSQLKELVLSRDLPALRLKDKSSFEFGVDIEKAMLDDGLAIYGSMSRRAASKFGFDIGLRFNF